jgi:hypothetical protein
MNNITPPPNICNLQHEHTYHKKTREREVGRLRGGGAEGLADLESTRAKLFEVEEENAQLRRKVEVELYNQVIIMCVSVSLCLSVWFVCLSLSGLCVRILYVTHNKKGT